MSARSVAIINKINGEVKSAIKENIPQFRVGDTVKVHAKIIEGEKERVQVFEGLVVRRTNRTTANATFTVRKISFNVGVERTFLLYSPRIQKIELISTGKVRRSKLFYLRPLRGKAARIESQRADNSEASNAPALSTSAGASEAAQASA
jgi:large subunit ribosomal protein L19